MPAHSAKKSATGGTAKQKENLNWKINYLAAQLGDKSRIPRANLAAKSLVKEKDSANIDEDALRLQLLELKAEKINNKLFHATREVRKLIKKAKSAEVQRLVKKSKAANAAQDSGNDAAQKRASKDTPEKIDQELTLVKLLDLDSIAAIAIRNKINKLGSVKHSDIAPKLKFSAEAPSKTAKDVSEEEAKLQRNLEARLLNFNPIKKELAQLVADIDTILQAGSQTAQADGENAVDADGNEADTEIDGDDAEAEAEAEADADQRDKDDADDEEDKEKNSKAAKRKAKAEPNVQKVVKAKKAKTNKKTEVEASSTFVSTLYSGSDESDVDERIPKKKQKKNPDDWTDENFEKYYGAPKKNRPGQRARRGKWEKLYGEEAKHVKASIEAEKAREERKLARQLKKSASGGNKTSLGKQRRNASDPSKPTKAKPSDEQLHPSWEAKKLQQDLMAKALSGSGGLANKKIVFEDSD